MHRSVLTTGEQVFGAADVPALKKMFERNHVGRTIHHAQLAVLDGDRPAAQQEGARHADFRSATAGAFTRRDAEDLVRRAGLEPVAVEHQRPDTRHGQLALRVAPRLWPERRRPPARRSGRTPRGRL